MQLIDSPIPLSPLARRGEPPVPAAECNDVTDIATSPDPATPAAVSPQQPIVQPDPDIASPDANDLHITVPRRFMREGRWPEIARVRDEMMRAALAKMTKADARAWCYAELDRLYPPLNSPNLSANDGERDAGVSSATLTGDAATVDQPRAREADSTANGNSVTERVTPSQQSAPESSRLQGLGDVPATWLPLPANASLAAEIGWVQANRLYVVEERGNATIVHLDRAHEPAPSRAAIGWLETSIRSYAKYVDVVGKCMGVESDESSAVRRERMALAEIRSLLDEMHSD